MAGKKGMHDKLTIRPDAIERIRQRVLSSRIAERLVKHSLGETEMSTSQVRAAEVMLRKVMPDLASTELTDKREGLTDYLKRVAASKQGVSGTKPADPPAAQPVVDPGLETPVVH